jgi:hypothetical protein
VSSFEVAGRGLKSKGSDTRRHTVKRSAAAGRRGWKDLDRRLISVLGRITERDRALCRLLDDHRVLTSPQVTEAFFSGERRARTRLLELYELDILERFRIRTMGNPGPLHWLLGSLGAALVAAEAGIEVADLDWRRGLVNDLAASQRLGHLTGINGFFTSLMRSERTGHDGRLEAWWSERRCVREWGEVIRPDGFGVWSGRGGYLPFLLEHDNGTERLARLTANLDGYDKFDKATGHTNWVLFTFPSARREREARKVLVNPTVLVATAARTVGFAPAESVWLPVGSDGSRLRLIQLAGLPGGGAKLARDACIGP